MTDVMETSGGGRVIRIVQTTVISLLVFFSALQTAHADDTEVFFSARSGTINHSKANVMLILDTSSSMTNTDSGQNGTRIERMKTALDEILRNARGVNIGLMRFNAPGGPVLYPVSDIDGVVEEGSSVFVRDVLLDIVAEDMEAAGGQSWGSTPIVDVLYEAGQYFRGGPVRYGKNRGYDGGPSSGYKTAQKRQFNRLSHPKSYTHGTVVRTGACNDGDLNALSCISEKIIDDDPTDGVSGPVYISPMTDECQANHIVLLSDGEATVNDSSPYVIDLLDISESECNSRTSGEKCGLNLAEFLSHEDQSDLPDDQTITVRTIGFNLDGDGQVFLNKMASKGGSGAAEEANSAADLLAVFEKVLDNVDETESTFATPGVAVSSYNRLNHADDLYFSLFKPENTPLWGGNLKKYKLSDGKVISKEGDTVSAVGSDGYFTDSSQDYWSTLSRSSDGYDGSKVGVGGVLESLKEASSRKVLTYLGSYAKNGFAQSFIEIEDSDKVEDNSGLTKEVLNVLDEGDKGDKARGELIQWIVDKTRVADPLHSSPHIVSYTDESIVYFGDNQGFLHAVDSESGEEVFAFMPQELLANQTILKNGVPGEEHLYGLDGGVTTWINDLDGDGLVSAGESAYLYIGMRRGGKNYYALDVTDADNPKLQWVIEGGKSGSDFSELGQSWSQPTKARVIIGSEVKDVLIFAAGYDEDQDDALVRTADTEGRGIFMVDALTGAKLWSGGTGLGMDDSFGDMKYSIPSRVVALDLNADGYTEKMYVGDMGGQLWRFDIANGKSGAGLVDGGVVFTASVDGNAAENRRFYHEPDLSLYRKNREQILAIKIGSGFQAHPLLKNGTEGSPQTSTDRFYMIKDTNVRNVPVSYVNLVESNLYDATDNLIVEGDATNEQLKLDGQKGWYITLNRDGEKVLASSLTVNNEVYFTTFEPSLSVEPCEPVPGVARVYQVSVVDASPVGESMDELTAIDRETVLDTGFIAPTPIRIVVDGKELILAGPEIISEPAVFAKKYTKTFWQEQ
ncbi:hypothetical protein A9Q99_12405 [Gammaproteobacteria bacterium 45_16_T64]|nr:hypothetical protein A9Q99_12405 [Gammaproteobacteria bacterium 45_16_T64]